MDDTKTIAETTPKVSIGGIEYEIQRPPQEVFERIGMVLMMDAPESLKVEAASQLIKRSVGDAAWTEILRAYMAGTIKVSDIFDVLKQFKGAGEASAPDA